METVEHIGDFNVSQDVNTEDSVYFKRIIHFLDETGARRYIPLYSVFSRIRKDISLAPDFGFSDILKTEEWDEEKTERALQRVDELYKYITSVEDIYDSMNKALICHKLYGTLQTTLSERKEKSIEKTLLSLEMLQSTQRAFDELVDI